MALTGWQQGVIDQLSADFPHGWWNPQATVIAKATTDEYVRALLTTGGYCWGCGWPETPGLYLSGQHAAGCPNAT